MYDPVLGTFINRDPIAADVNLYRYSGNSPENRVDPSGCSDTSPSGMARDIALESEAAKYLTGGISFRATKKPSFDSQEYELAVTISRRNGPRDLAKWNKIGDTDVPDEWDRKAYGVDSQGRKWLWPNLAKLLSGDYGGWDPYKERSNDFMSVLVRSYNAKGKLIDEKESHTWQVNGKMDGEVAHSAKLTQDFSAYRCGKTKIWITFLDTFDKKYRPEGYPAEDAGYTLAYFEVRWSSTTYLKYGLYGGAIDRASIEQDDPPPPSNYDWPTKKRW